MYSQATRITDVGDVVKKLQGIDKPPPSFHPAGKLKAHESPMATSQISVGPLLDEAILLRWIDDPDYCGMLRKTIGNDSGVGTVPLHPQ